MGKKKGEVSPRNDPAGEPRAPVYEITVQGCMEETFWTDWFGGLACTSDLSQGETTLRGPIADQAELYGLLSRLRNKGLTLISVQQMRLEPDAAPDTPANA